MDTFRFKLPLQTPEAQNVYLHGLKWLRGVALYKLFASVQLYFVASAMA